MSVQQLVLFLCVISKLSSIKRLGCIGHHVCHVERVGLEEWLWSASVLRSHTHRTEGQTWWRYLAIWHYSTMMSLSRWSGHGMMRHLTLWNLSWSIDHWVLQPSSWLFIHTLRPLLSQLWSVVSIVRLLSSLLSFTTRSCHVLSLLHDSALTRHDNTIVHVWRGCLKSAFSHHD